MENGPEMTRDAQPVNPMTPGHCVQSRLNVGPIVFSFTEDSGVVCLRGTGICLDLAARRPGAYSRSGQVTNLVGRKGFYNELTIHSISLAPWVCAFTV